MTLAEPQAEPPLGNMPPPTQGSNSRHLKKPNARPQAAGYFISQPRRPREDQDLILKAAATMAAALLAASVAAPGPAQVRQKLVFSGPSACDCRAVGDVLVSDF